MGVPFKVQSNALLRKSALYQRRNVCTNICLLAAPLFFCIILLLIKVLINSLLLSGVDFKCGCECVSCYNKTSGVQVDIADNGYTCDGDQGLDCKSYNNDNCGLQYSTPQQASYCAVPQPTPWPASFQAPAPKFRASAPATNETAMAQWPKGPQGLGLGTLQMQVVAQSDASGYFRAMFPAPSLQALNETFDLFFPNGTLNPDNTFATVATNPTLLTDAGIMIATNATPRVNNYIDNAFAPTQYLNSYVLVPPGQCEARGLPTTSTVSLTEFLLKYFNISSAVGNATAIQEQDTTEVACAETILSPQASNSDVATNLRCGYWQARCYEGKAINNEYSAAWDFQDSGSTHFSIVNVYNETLQQDSDSSQLTLRLPAVLDAAVRGWLSKWHAQALGALERGAGLLGTASFPKQSSKLKLDFSNFLGPLFYTWVVQMLLPSFLQQLVYEKEKGLRIMMKMHGLGDPSYWFVTYLWMLVLYIVYIVIFVIFGAAIGLEIFRRNSLGIQAIFYFLFGNCMIALAFFLSSFFTSSRTATVFGFLYVFASGLIGQLMLSEFMQQCQSWILYLEWVPAWSLYRGLWEFGEYAFYGVYTDSRGMTFGNLNATCNGMIATWIIFAVEWVIFLVLGWYLEQVLSTGTGVRRHPLFFLDRWLGKRRKEQEQRDTRSSLSGGDGDAKIEVTGSGVMADVHAERHRVENMSEADMAATPIVVNDLRKIYPGQDGGKPKLAVRTLTLAIDNDECFGLLGPNGAGKSTSINMLTGFLEPTSGYATVDGKSILSEMNQIYAMMGVCPQHDLLWENLTGREHLLFYGRLKGLSGSELTDAVDVGLRTVNLHNVANKVAGKYSGGMKRRLSVAISFMGSPKVVYLDEPSTGLDPASRRQLWSVVKQNRKGRAIILTTHSMEEAEMLCDRLGIFVDGQLVCIGNPREITSRYAGYLVFTVTVAHGHEEGVRQMVLSLSPSARMTYSVGGTVKYELPTSEVTLSSVFAAVADAKEHGLQLLDWGVANATLEEVFIKLARQVGAETAAGH